VTGRVDAHGRLKAVEATRQGRAGQLDRERFVHANLSSHGAQRPAVIVAEHAASGDICGEIKDCSLRRGCAADAKGEANRG
jgi:hypothetical protein